jgi:hypothetical protein
MHCLQGYSLSRARESSILGKLLTFILPFLLVGRAEGQFNLRGRFDQKVNAGGTNTITGSFDIYSKLSEVLPGADKYLFGYISGEKTGNPNIALFDYLGQRRVSTQLTTNKVIAFTVRSDYTIVLGSQLASPKREVWSISYVAFPTQYTMSKTSSVNPTIDAERADHDTTSTYVFFATVQKCDRLDTSTMALSTVATFSTANANTVLCSGCTSIIEVIVDEPKPYFAILPFDNKLAVMTRTSLTSIITYANGPALIEGACLDNLGSNIVFALLNNYGNSNKYAVATLDFTITDTTKLPVATFVNTPYSSSQVCSNNIVNVGPLAYIMFIPSLLDNGKIYIYGKTPLAFVSSTLSPASNLGYTTECFTVVGTQLVDDRYYFTTRAETGSLSVNSHYLSADFCNSRDASNICQVCAAGYVRSSLSPNNICILPSQITSGNGIDIPTNSVMACTSANCLKCTSDRTICNTCSTTPQTYLYNGACYTVATAPAGVGVSTTTTMATCTTTQCVSCAADNAVCLACNSTVSPRYYLQGNNCVLLSSVTGAFGATATGTIAACTVSGCTACLNDNTICTACTSGSTWLITNQCLAPASFPAGTGVTSPTTTGPCTSAGCQTCSASASTCTVCNTGGGYYMYSGACYTTGTMPNGYGLSGTTVVACQSTGCTSCGPNYAVCTACNTGSNYYLSGTSCILVTSIPAGSGANTATGTVQTCQTLNCANCQANYQTCVTCAPTYYLFGSTCVSSPPAGYGISGSTIVACTVSNCQTCSPITTCTACNTGSSYYLTTSNTCILQSAIPSGSGVNTATGTVVTCQSTGCTNCQANYAVCTACNTGSNYYLSGSVCILVTSIPAGSGANTATGTVQTCQALNCANCQANYLTCTACAPTYYLFGSTCVSSPPAGYGISGSTIVACSVSNCQTCSPITTCTACNTGSSYYLNTASNTCILQSAIPSGSGVNTAAGTVVTCQSTGCTNCQANYAVCTACNTGSNYYLSGTSCTPLSSIPAGSGVNTATGTVQTCQTLNCANCQANYLTCTACAPTYYLFGTTCVSSPPAGYGISGSTIVACTVSNCQTCSPITTCTACNTGSSYYLTTSNTCILQSAIPSGSGVNTAAGTVVTCQSPGCTNCQANFLTCTACNTGSNYYLSGTSCILQSAIPAGSGINTGTGTIVPCQASNCANCQANYLTCTACAPTYYLFGTTCVSSPPAGYGISGSTIVACSVSNCQTCSPITTCTACNTGSSYYLNTASNTCILQSAIPSGSGVNTAAGTVVTCQSTGCTNCQANYAVCTACNTGSNYYLSGSVCILVTSIPAGSGANTATGTVQTCQALNCANCQANYLTCTACAPTYYLFGSTCVSSPPAGYGISGSTIVACSVSNCQTCSPITTCTACNTGSSYYLNTASNTCILQSAIPSGSGVNTAAGTVVTCQSTGCTNCQANYAVCTACNTGSNYYLSGTSCTPLSSIPAGSGVNTATGTVQTCQALNCANCQANYLTCTACAPTYYLFGTTCVSSPPAGYGISGSTIVACTVSNCQTCSPITTYTACNTGSSYYLTTSNTCILQSAIPSGSGVNTAVGTVVTCQSTGCTNCQANYAVCTACNTGSNYYLSGTSCTPLSSIPAGSGANPTTGTVVPCQAGCTNCQANYLACTACTAGYYLYNSACTPAGSIPPGLGPNGAILSPCSTQGCTNCATNYQTCTACNPPSTYLYINSCIPPSPLPPSTFLDTATGKIVPCSVSGCLSCSPTVATCTACNTAANPPLYLTATNTCIPPTSMPANQGPDLSTGQVVGCADLSCTTCQTSITVCTSCGGGKFVYQNQCVLPTSVPPGFGPNPVTGHIEPCTSPGCTDCLTAVSVCNACSPLYTLDSTAHSCTPKPAPPGLGMDPATGTFKQCNAGPGCLLCATLYTSCEQCDDSHGYSLPPGQTKCVDLVQPMQISIIANPHKKDSVHASLLLVISDLSSHSSRDFSQLALHIAQTQSLQPVLAIADRESGRPETASTQVTFLAVGNTVIIDILFLDSPLFGWDRVVGAVRQAQRVEMGGQWYSLNLCEGETEYRSGVSSGEVESAKKMGEMTTWLTGWANPHSPQEATALIALIALDPTGTFFRFTKILQIVNKLYFININYGKRLEAFLWWLHRTPPNNDSPTLHVYSSSRYRGKLSLKHEALDFFDSLTVQTVMYLCSAVLAISARLLRRWVRLGHFGVHAVYFVDMVHLIIFNLVFIDFIWLAPRTLMHLDKLPLSKLILGLVVAGLLSFDAVKIGFAITTQTFWLHHAKQTHTLPPDSTPDDADDSQADNSSVQLVHSSSVSPQSKQINYKKTYFEIELNRPLMRVLTSLTRLDDQTASSLLVRLLSAVPWAKTTVYHVLIVSCQYCPQASLCALALVEMTLLFATIYAYLKYKYLKNIICLLMEVVPPAAMTLFCLNALAISPKRFDEIIMDFYQDAGIWIVIASCVAEYLLLITYIAVAAYEFFKNRKMMKKMNVKPEKYSLIHYADLPKNLPSSDPNNPSTSKNKYSSLLSTKLSNQSTLPISNENIDAMIIDKSRVLAFEQSVNKNNNNNKNNMENKDISIDGDRFNSSINQSSIDDSVNEQSAFEQPMESNQANQNRLSDDPEEIDIVKQNNIDGTSQYVSAVEPLVIEIHDPESQLY